MLLTIGYEKAELGHFLGTLQQSDVDIVVDIRDRAQSRRRGFSKTALSNALTSVGISYEHIRELGDPKPGRDAARAGQFGLFREIYRSVLNSAAGQDALAKIERICRTKNVCLLCYERDQTTCHRKMVSDILEAKLNTRTIHLGVQAIEPSFVGKRRVFHSHQSAAA